ncbi:MAG: DNA mismatch repair endonuclease MutL [Eubacterium sp.]
MIQVLDKNVSDKIAAGEVIDRPVSVIKELVENSIDAGASAITVEIRHGGKEYMRVTDDGCGIPSAETETAFLRHATSKIQKAEDLDSIESLGFRGEALASIAAVTRTTLITRTKDSPAGRKVVLHGGRVLSNDPVGCPVGSSMVVSDLFYNTPARKQFLKSDSAESGRIIELLSELAIAYCRIRFQVVNSGRLVFATSGSGNLKETIISVYHQKDYEQLLPLKYEEKGIRITGCISRPSLTRPSRRNQTYFVNGRVVKSRVLERGVTEGYKRRMFDGRYPVVFLLLESDPGTLDVNIHPSKKEVRFHDDRLIQDTVTHAVRQTLATLDAAVDVQDYYLRQENAAESKESRVQGCMFSDATSGSEPSGSDQTASSDTPFTDSVQESFSVSSGKEARTQKAEGHSFHGSSGSGKGKAERAGDSAGLKFWQNYASQLDLKQILQKRRKEKEQQLEEKAQNTAGAASGQGKTKDPRLDFDLQLEGPAPFSFSDLTLKGCIFNTYIMAEGPDGFYLFDQHAAHERCFYEELVGAYLTEKKVRQPILMPIVLETEPAVTAAESFWRPPLENMGYSIENFGPDTYRIGEIPSFMSISEAEDFAKDFLDQAGADPESAGQLRNNIVIDKLITRSCKRAVKAHEKLTDAEMHALIRQLSECKNPFSCPHGRPTFIRFTRRDLEKFFKRIQ